MTRLNILALNEMHTIIYATYSPSLHNTGSGTDDAAARHCRHDSGNILRNYSVCNCAHYMEYALKISFSFLIFCTIEDKISKQGGDLLKKIAVLLITILIIVGMVNLKSIKREQNRQEITLGAPITKNIVETVTLYGTVQEKGRKVLYANGSAKIETVHVSVGDMVQEGDPLVSLRPIDESQQTTTGYTDITTWTEQLYWSGITDPEKIETEIQTVFNRILASGQQNEAENSDDVYTLYSPISGMVVSISGKQGDGITKYFPAVIVTDLNQLVVRADVSESALRQIDLADACSITVPALGDQTYSGEIQFISPYAHETDLLSGGGTYVTEVITKINNFGNILRPGYQATVKVTIGEQKNVLLIPYDAIAQDENGQEYAMIWTGKQAYRQNLITGTEVDDFVQILSGISENQQVIRDVNKINFTEELVLYEAS